MEDIAKPQSWEAAHLPSGTDGVGVPRKPPAHWGEPEAGQKGINESRPQRRPLQPAETEERLKTTFPFSKADKAVLKRQAGRSASKPSHFSRSPELWGQRGSSGSHRGSSPESYRLRGHSLPPGDQGSVSGNVSPHDLARAPHLQPTESALHT